MTTTQLSISPGRPDPIDHTTRLTPPSLDAAETLKAVQGVINSFLSDTRGGRGSIPTPEPSPVPKFEGEDGCQAAGMREGAYQMKNTSAASMETRELGGINGRRWADRKTLPTTSSTVTEPESLAEPDNPQVVTSNQRIIKMGSMETPACLPAQANGLSDYKRKPSPNMANLDRGRLRDLADEIQRNVLLAATDDDARIKTATAALELANAVRPPVDTIMGWFANMSVVSAVRLFQHWGAFSAIPSGPGESISYSDLAAKIDTDEGLLTRVVSMLTSSGLLTYNPEGPSLSHTTTSLLLLPHHPLSAMFDLMYNHIAAVSTILPAYFDTYGRAEPVGPSHIPTSYLAGHPEEDYFTLLKKDEAALKSFMLAMGVSTARVPVTGAHLQGMMEAVCRIAQEKRKEVVWVDVGGGDGHTVREFLRAYGGVGLKAEQCVVQDLEEVVVAGQAKVEQEKGKDGELKGVRWMALDFLREVPAKGALVYYLRHILRDYSDPVATTILRSIAPALTDPDARVLIAEQLNPDQTTTAAASSSSSSNNGGGAPLPLYAAFKDYSMLSVGGKERSLAQFAAVADAASLRVSRVYRDETTAHAVVELALKVEDGDEEVAV